MFHALPDDLAMALNEAAARLGPFADVRYLPEVASTNDVALTLAASGAAEGTTVVAGTQHAGRGRRGHEWYSPPEAGLYVSTIVRPTLSRGAALLTLAAGVAAADAVIHVTGLPVELKWPNDLVIGRPWRKLGGVLAEGTSAGARLDAVVVGIGLNIRHAVVPPSLLGRATSIEGELGRFVDRAALLVDLLVRLGAVAAQLRAGEQATLARDWRRLGRRGFGATVRWSDSAGEHRGLVRDIDDDGALVVETPGGRVRIVAGALTWQDVPGE